jgi:hypothetical protein
MHRQELPMKSSPSSAAPRDGTPARRRLVVGAGVAAGAALAVAALQRRPETKTPMAAADSEPPSGQGYRLTEHVRRYYETTRT